MELNYVSFSCLSLVEWSQQPVNDIITSTTELRGHQVVPIDTVSYFSNANYTGEAFVDVQFGPVICTAGMYP